jgi:ABC-2 type transport system permease protein
MLNYRIIAVIKRELREKVLSKTFIFTTILLPVLMFGILGVQALIMTYEGDGNTKIEIVSETDALTNRFYELNELDFVKNGSYTFIYKTIPKQQFENYINEKKEDLINNKLTGIIYIPETALVDKKIEYYSKTPKNFTVTEKIDGPINKILIDAYFSGKNLSDEELTFARKGINFTGYKISEEEEIEEEGYGNLVLAYLFSFLLYISLLMSGSMTMQSVIEEKNNRIVEVLLSSVKSKELMAGKILGASITGVLQMAIWLSPIFVLVSTTIFILPPEFTIDITYGQIFYLLFNFFLGLVTFIGLFATVGSIFENSQEAQSGMWPVMLLIIIPFFIALSMMKNPTNPIAEIASLAPFASIIVMPAKMTLVDVPIWQFLLSIAINIATILLIFPVAGKIYQVGILRTGKKPKWSEVVRWLKYKY